MRNIWGLYQVSLLAAFFMLSACATEDKKPDSAMIPVNSISAEQEEIDVAGMIPSDCEMLFQKSQEWNYKPGAAWKFASQEQALDATRFFSSFTLVPRLSSKKFRVWLAENQSPGRAQKRMEEFTQIQVCDSFLVSTLMNALIAYNWDKTVAAEAKKNIKTYLFNQFPITSPLLSLATNVQLAYRAYQKKILSIHSASSFLRIHEQIKKEVAKNEELFAQQSAPEGQEELIRAEFAKSEKFRESLGKLLPLP